MKDLRLIEDLQDAILRTTWDLASEIPTWKMTGGTALTKFHGFCHRFSEDLDFFFDLPPSAIKKIIDKWENLIYQNFPEVLISEFKVQEKGSAFVSRRMVEFASAGQTLIVDFVADPFPHLFPKEIIKTERGIVFRVDPLVGIGIKKIWAFHTSVIEGLPPRSKDVVDFYILGTKALDVVSLLDHYQSIFPEFSCENLLLFVRNQAPRLDYSNILSLRVDLKEMWRWYEDKIPEIIAKFRKEMQEQSEISAKDLESEIFRIKYPGP